MRLPKNTLQRLSEVTGISPKLLSEYTAYRMRPGAQRAFLLEDACRKLGLEVPARLWIEGPSWKIKLALRPPVKETRKKQATRKTASI